MAAQEFDVIVVGLGPGGESVAGTLAAAGLSVVGVEARLVGGECPYFGCIPSKLLLRAGNTLAEARRVATLAGAAQPTADFARVARRIREEATDHWDDTVAARRLTEHGAVLVRGTGALSGPREVTVRLREGGERVLRARRAIVLNPGSNPTVPALPGLAGTPYWTNRSALQAREAPESLLVLGGGPIGVELAQGFARFGSKVTVVVRGERLLRGDEPEAASVLAEVFAREGIEVLCDTGVRSVSHSGDAFTLALHQRDGADAGSRTARALLLATGRTPAVAGLHLDRAGVAWDGHRPPVTDAQLRLAEGLFLIGDAVGAGAFTHMSMHHAGIVSAQLLGEPAPGSTTAAVPHVTFTDPEVAGVGLSEAAARAQGLRLRVGRTALPDSTRGWLHGPGNDGLVKVIEDAERGVLVGATAVGPSGGEMLSLLALAVHAAIPVSTLRSMVFAYPTFHRAIADALARLA